MIKVPKEIKYAELYFTIRCNLKCSYCINNYDTTLKRARVEVPAVELARHLNRIDFKDLPLTIGGGEPTVRKDFFELLRLLRSDINIDLLTNLSFDVENFVQETHPSRFTHHSNSAYKSIRVSYHPQQMNPEELVAKVSFLQDKGFQVGIFGISHPLNTEANIRMSELSRKSKVYFFIKDFLGTYNGHLFGFYKYPKGLDKIAKKCVCRTNELLIGPDGSTYKCHQDLYNLQYPVSSILDKEFKIDYQFRECQLFGMCNPCDLKLKANRFLDMGYCSVEIEENTV